MARGSVSHYMRRIYISGPMSGIPNFNASAFNNAERKLRNAGWFPINPIAVDALHGDTYEKERSTGVWISDHRTKYLKRDLEMIMSDTDPIDAVYMLRGWTNSRGATVENAVARALDKEIYYETPSGELPASLSVLGRPEPVWPHQRDQHQASAQPGEVPLGRQTAREFLITHKDTTQETMSVLAKLPIVPAIIPDPPPESILKEAERLVHGARQLAYGHPADDFARTAGMMNAQGYRKLSGNGTFLIRPEDIPIIMLDVKLSREVNGHKRDNLVDICGYAETLQMVHERKHAEWEKGRT